MGDVWDKSVENSKEGKVLLGKKKKEILERERSERARECENENEREKISLNENSGLNESSELYWQEWDNESEK